MVALLACLATLTISSCKKADYPDRFELTSGTPTIKSIRYAEKDVYITSAYMGEIICLLGDNLTSIQRLFFNDQEASLNTSYITENTLIVAVPGNMPTVTTNKIYMYNEAGDVTEYDFQILPPNPVITAMSCEWAPAGSTVTITGKYLFDDDNVPLTVSFPGADAESVTIVSSNEIQVVVPEGAQEGTVTVTTVSGSAVSKFHYKDTRNMLFDWDGKYGDARAIAQGWRDGSKVIRTPGSDSFDALDGNYIVFASDLKAGIGADWPEDPMSFNYWPSTANADNGPLCEQTEFADMINSYGVGGLSLKFECLIPSSNPWMACGMQLMFSSSARVTLETATNGYFGDATFPRGIWMPWYSNDGYAIGGNYDTSGSYDTNDEWVTVCVPLSDFVYTNDINTKCATQFTKDYLSGLTFFVWHGGVEGTECSPIIAIDNIRVVPNDK